MKSQLCIFLLIIQIDSIFTWENYELDLFDLVEELGLTTNFYDFIGVEKTAEVNEIKKAYRKLSLLWHPDKSDDVNAGEKFRHLVAVYEILKDEQRRARYDRILVEGLPKWNQPIFYYRRAKKLRFWEILTILTFIMTIGHYLVLWAIYFESSLAMVNERSVDVRKRLEKKMKKSSKIKGIDQNMIDEEMARIIPALESPRLTDILPIKFAQALVNQQFFIPYFKNLLTTLIHSRRQPSVVEPVLSSDGDDDDENHSTTKKSPVVRINDIVPEMATSRNAPVVSYLTTTAPSFENNQSSDSSNSTRPWSDEEKQLLCKTIVRFPPGTPRRWEKIADVIGRHVSHVIDMAKQIQNTVGSNSNTFQDINSSFSSSITTIDENLITERQQSESISDWSQSDQHLLECALKTIPKDTSGVDRWEQIARCIPGKTRDECLARYRHIVQLVKAKKMA